MRRSRRCTRCRPVAASSQSGSRSGDPRRGQTLRPWPLHLVSVGTRPTSPATTCCSTGKKTPARCHPALPRIVRIRGVSRTPGREPRADRGVEERARRPADGGGSHTAALAAKEVAVGALPPHRCDRADTLDEMLTWRPRSVASRCRPARVGIVTNAGGPGILCTDACESGGLSIPESRRPRGR